MLAASYFAVARRRLRNGAGWGIGIEMPMKPLWWCWDKLVWMFLISVLLGDTIETFWCSLVMETAYFYLSIMSAGLPVLYVLHVVRSAIQGMGNTALPMVSGAVEFIMRTATGRQFSNNA